jgi:hypothetical protein
MLNTGTNTSDYFLQFLALYITIWPKFTICLPLISFKKKFLFAIYENIKLASTKFNITVPVLFNKVPVPWITRFTFFLYYSTYTKIIKSSTPPKIVNNKI